MQQKDPATSRASAITKILHLTVDSTAPYTPSNTSVRKGNVVVCFIFPIKIVVLGGFFVYFSSDFFNSLPSLVSIFATGTN